MKKEKFKRVRVLCREDSLRDVLAALLSGNFKSEVPATKNEAALDFRRVEGDDPYEKPIICRLEIYFAGKKAGFAAGL